MDIFNIIGYTVNIALMPVIAFIFLRCFYDDSIKISGLKILICLLAEIPTVALIQLDSSEILEIGLIPEIILKILYIAVPSAVFCGRKRKIFYYIKKLITSAFLSFLLWVPVSAFTILTNMLLMRLGIISADNETVYHVFNTAVTVALILWLYFGFIRRNIQIYMRKTDTFLFIIYFIFVITILSTSSYNIGYSGDEVMFSSFIQLYMILLIILVPVIIIKNRQSAYYNELSTRNEQFLEVELAASNAYRKSQEDTRAFRHDMNNNLLIISAMMQKKQYNEAEEYINSLCEKLSSFSPKIVTGDNMLDSLLSSKLPVMEEKKINFEINGVIDKSLEWKPIDVCAVFANLIDNAIEACDKITDHERYINITIRKTDFQYIITFHNSVAQSVDCSQLNDDTQYTSKPDKSRHGFGMKNIRNTLAEYGAIMQVSCTDTEFTTQIIIMK